MQAIRHGTMLPSLQRNEISTSELDPFRSSILGPWSPLRTLDVGPRGTPRITRGRGGWLVLTPWGTLTSYSLPAFLAHSGLAKTKGSAFRRYVCLSPTGRDSLVRPSVLVDFATNRNRSAIYSYALMTLETPLVRHRRDWPVSEPESARLHLAQL